MAPQRAHEPSARLQVFVSYATEDEKLATAIGEELRKAFSPTTLKVWVATEFRVGAPWRQEIEDALSRADILVIVATGTEKMSHSFTGYEVGYFKASMKSHPKMTRFKSERRLIIPIAIATDVPGPVADIQSVQLNQPFETLTIKQQALRSQNVDVKYEPKSDPLYKLFARIFAVIGSRVDLTDDERANYDQTFRECSDRLHRIIVTALRERIWTEDFPERKIIVRVENDRDKARGDDPLSSATVEFVGRSFEVFGFSPPRTGELPCERFLASVVNEEVKVIWDEILRSQVISAQRGDFRENRHLIASPDQTQFFRLFAARSIVYYSGTREIHVHVVEIKSRNYGDPNTTMLLKAISSGLYYRFMFLERGSEFSPEAFSLTLLNDLRDRVSRLRQELDYLVWMSRDLGQASSLLSIYGDTLEPGEIDEKAALWEMLRKRLCLAASDVLRARDSEQLAREKSKFIDELKVFCASTMEMNREYTSKALQALAAVVSKPKDIDEDGQAGIKVA